MNISYIALGSNLSDPIEQVKLAITALDNMPQSRLIKVSSLYTSSALTLDKSDIQPDYINAVAAIETSLTPIKLLDTLQNIEATQGRVRTNQRWTSRILDLDILLYNDEIINSDRLTIPHYAMTERAFVLYPLFEIAPDLTFPDHSTLALAITQINDDDLQQINTTC